MRLSKGLLIGKGGGCIVPSWECVPLLSGCSVLPKDGMLSCKLTARLTKKLAAKVEKPPLPPHSKTKRGAMSKERHCEILDSVLLPGSSDGEALLTKIKERTERYVPRFPKLCRIRHLSKDSCC